MILNENSIAVIIALDNDKDVIAQTLPVWIRVCTAYGNGAEIFLVNKKGDEETDVFMGEFLNMYVNAGIKIAYLTSEDNSLSQAYNLPNKHDLIQAKYVLFARGDSYPNGYLLNEFEPELDRSRVLLGTRKYIKSPFNYSVMRNEMMEHYQRFLDVHRDERPWELYIANNSIIPKMQLDFVGWWNEDIDDRTSAQELAMLLHMQLGCKFYSLDQASMFVCGPSIGEVVPANKAILQKCYERYTSGNYDRHFRKRKKATA